MSLRLRFPGFALWVGLIAGSPAFGEMARSEVRCSPEEAQREPGSRGPFRSVSLPPEGRLVLLVDKMGATDSAARVLVYDPGTSTILRIFEARSGGGRRRYREDRYGAKQERGDGRTPEGLYRIQKRRETCDHLDERPLLRTRRGPYGSNSFLLDYPNEADRPQRTGGDIAIHGGRDNRADEKRFTDGCIRLLGSQDLEALAHFAYANMPVIIVKELHASFYAKSVRPKRGETATAGHEVDPCWSGAVARVLFGDPKTMNLRAQTLQEECKPDRGDQGVREPDPPPNDGPRCSARYDIELDRGIHIYFGRDRFAVEAPSCLSRLQDLSRALRSATETIHIQGHADERGPAAYNTALGCARARWVQRYLIDQGVDESLILVSTRGEHAPAVEGDSAVAWDHNRRAFMVVGRVPKDGGDACVE